MVWHWVPAKMFSFRLIQSFMDKNVETKGTFLFSYFLRCVFFFHILWYYGDDYGNDDDYDHGFNSPPPTPLVVLLYCGRDKWKNGNNSAHYNVLEKSCESLSIIIQQNRSVLLHAQFYKRKAESRRKEERIYFIGRNTFQFKRIFDSAGFSMNWNWNDVTWHKKLEKYVADFVDLDTVVI